MLEAGLLQTVDRFLVDFHYAAAKLLWHAPGQTVAVLVLSCRCSVAKCLLGVAQGSVQTAARLLPDCF